MKPTFIDRLKSGELLEQIRSSSPAWQLKSGAFMDQVRSKWKDLTVRIKNIQLPDRKMETEQKQKPKSRLRIGRLVALLVAVCLVIGLIGWGGFALVSWMTRPKEDPISWKLSKEELASLDTIACPSNIEQETFDQLRTSALSDDEGDVAQMDRWVLAHIDEYDQDLLEFYLRDHDRFTFVHEWADRDQYQEPVETLEEGTEEIPSLLQWDLRWGYQPYGDSLIYIAGCAPTCMSMITSYLNHDATLTPRVMADFAFASGDYYSGQGTASTFFQHAADQYGLTIEDVGIDEQSVKDALSSGKILIFHMMPGIFTTVGHYIIGYGLDEEGKMLIKDPNSIARTNMTWDIPEVLGECAGIWAFSKPAETESAQ